MTFCGQDSNTSNQLWVTFKHLRLCMGCIQTNTLYGMEGEIVDPIFLFMDFYGWLQYTRWVNGNVKDMRTKHHYYTSFFWHIKCKWSVSGTFNRTCCDTTPLNLTLKSACAARPVLNACSTVLILTNHHSDTVFSIDFSIGWVWEGDWWMTCTTLGDTVKGQR